MRRLVATAKDVKIIEEWSKIRWLNGPACLYCKSQHVKFIPTRAFYQCNECRKQFGIFTNTRWSGMKLSPSKLKKYLRMIFNGMEAVIVQEIDLTSNYGGSYKVVGMPGFPIRVFMRASEISSFSTAHRLFHKIEKEIDAIYQASLIDKGPVSEWFASQSSFNEFIAQILS